MFSIPVMAMDIEELPVITRWENGNGYGEGGKRLEDTWAYDSVHEAGRYVLFGKTGEVLKKFRELGKERTGKRKLYGDKSKFGNYSDTCRGP